jgi:superfamily II DNA or RNA helicase
MNIGDWVWDKQTQQPIQIISIDSIWGKEAIKAYFPNENHLKIIEHSRIAPIQENPIQSTEALKHLVISAKIKNIINSNELLSPTQADIIPLPHQIFALDESINSDRIRYLFADEVGLGKTIEAGLVLTELKNQGLARRILIVSPRGLTKQWIDELYTKFNESFQLIIPGKMTELQEINIWLQADQVVTSLDSVKPLRKRTGWSQEKIDQYNEKRYYDLIAANWDLIIIDEAHKIAGASTGVARHRLGQSLSEAAPYLLLLSATPHQGKTEQFKRLLSLLDQDNFESLEFIKKEQVQPYVIRTEKRTSIDHEGNSLFTPRTTKLVPVTWGLQHNEQRKLYDEVTDYIRFGYNKAIEEKRAYIGFLMVLMQRLVSSSTRAIRQALEKRLEVLETGESFYSEEQEQDLFTDVEGQIRIDELFLKIGDSLRDEKREVDNLASLARRCENKGPDARAEALINLLYDQRTEEKNPDLKFLIFTEFLPTQEMLREFLETRGFTIETLNGSMDLNTRLEAQNKFAEEADILISTEAGGEGINLQFCHIIINYDLPWNPMRIEQRIGRVDRIGQKHPVKAFNLVFENTVEFRIRQVLEEKLEIILKEFGVDKLSDVLDADDAEMDLSNIYRDAILTPDKATDELETYLEKIKTTINKIKQKEIYSDYKTLTLQRSKTIANHPLPSLTEKLTLNYLKMKKENIEINGELYQLNFPDGTQVKDARFHPIASYKGKLVSARFPSIHKLIHDTSRYVEGMRIPIIKLSKIPSQLSGYWSLWKVTMGSSLSSVSNHFPIFINDKRQFLKPSSNQLWELFLQDTSKIEISGYDNTDPFQVFNHIKEIALVEGETKLDSLNNLFNSKILKIKQKNQARHKLKLQSLNRIRAVKERTLKIETIEKEFNEWLIRYDSDTKPFYELKTITLFRVEALEK